MAPAESTLVDIPHECRWSRPTLKLVLLFVAISFGAMALVLAIILAMRSWTSAPASLVSLPIMLVTLATGLALARYFQRRQTRRFETVVKANAADPRAAMNAVAGELSGRLIGPGIVAATRSLRAAGHQGLAFRIGPPGQLPALQPLAVEFEPTSINETDPAFIGLQHVDVPSPVAAAGSARAERESRFSSSEAGRHLRRARKLGMAWSWLAFGVVFAINVVLAILQRRITVGVVLWGLALAVSVLGPRMAVSSQGTRFLMMPASLLWRRTRPMKRNYELHLFDRRVSILTTCLMRSGRWMWAVADGDKHAQGFNTRDEVEMLLRAWLSPLPSPPLTRLEEMAGS